MMSGFFRGPDIMGWHASLVFMIAAIMAIRSRGAARMWWIGLAIWAMVSMWICGRRKIVAMIPLFAGFYIVLFYYLRGIRRLFSMVILVVLILGLGAYLITSYAWQVSVADYYMSTFPEAGEQFRRHGFDSALETIRQAGFWGYGLGMGQQGTQHIDVEKPRLWQESGPTKVLVELGVPGTVIFLIVFGLLFMTAYALLRTRMFRSDFVISAGIMSILLSNLMAAVVSAQIYTDPFISFMLAGLTGMLFASAKFDTSKQDA
jgi:O-antigen ligase